MPENGRHEKA
jgi:CTLH/CRA C-terminal to LisH motif domain